MNKENNSTIYYRKSGHYVEFKDIDKYYWFYNIKKTLSWICDVTLLVTSLFLLIWIFEFSILNSSLITFGLAFLYYLGQLSLFEGKTIGMMIAGIRLINYDGHRRYKWTQYIVRSLSSALYAIWFIAAFMVVFNILSAIFNRSLTCVDLFSRTQVVSKPTYYQLQDILSGIEKR